MIVIKIISDSDFWFDYYHDYDGDGDGDGGSNGVHLQCGVIPSVDHPILENLRSGDSLENSNCTFPLIFCLKLNWGF